MDFALTATQERDAAEARSVAASFVADLDIAEDGWLRGMSDAFAAAMAERGWLGMTWPTELGGAGRSALDRFVVVEALISEGAPLASVWFADRQIGPTLLQFGTADQRDEFLPPIIRGTARWCIGMSEPDAGSDVASLRTLAERVPGGWSITGSKVWTSGAALADWCYLIARTDVDAPRHASLSEFIVDMAAPGIEIRTIPDMSGDHHFCEVFLDHVFVPETRLVGTPNQAFRQIMRQMEHERGGIDRLASNRRLLVDVVEHVRRLGGAANPGSKTTVADLEARYRIGRLLVMREVLGQAAPGFSAVTKTWCTEYEVDVANACASLLGPQSTAHLADDRLARRLTRNLCYAPGYTIMGGTTQILRNVIGERNLGLPRP